jgi:hypothetical protein
MTAPVPPAPSLTLPKKPFFIPWFWEPAVWELEDQLSGYREIGWFRSYRGLAACALLFYCLILAVFVLGGMPAGVTSPAMLLGLVPYLVLAPLVGRGSSRACAITMVVWTLERGLSLIAGFASPLTWLVHPAWWMFYMQFFWKAYTIERMRCVAGGSATTAAGDPSG